MVNFGFSSNRQFAQSARIGRRAACQWRFSIRPLNTSNTLVSRAPSRRSLSCGGAVGRMRWMEGTGQLQIVYPPDSWAGEILPNGLWTFLANYGIYQAMMEEYSDIIEKLPLKLGEISSTRFQAVTLSLLFFTLKLESECSPVPLDSILLSSAVDDASPPSIPSITMQSGLSAPYSLSRPPAQPRVPIG